LRRVLAANWWGKARLAFPPASMRAIFLLNLIIVSLLSLYHFFVLKKLKIIKILFLSIKNCVKIYLKVNENNIFNFNGRHFGIFPGWRQKTSF
jgi:hypothetical protein